MVDLREYDLWQLVLKFIRFFWPVLAGLRDLGGSASPADVVDLVVERVGIGDEERAERTKSGCCELTTRCTGPATTSFGQACLTVQSEGNGHSARRDGKSRWMIKISRVPMSFSSRCVPSPVPNGQPQVCDRSD